MRKKILCLFTLFILCGCSTYKDAPEIKTDIPDKEIEGKEEYIDDNPIKLGIFLADDYNYNNKKVIKDTYYTEFINSKDIGSFEVFFTDDEVVDGPNFKSIFNNYYNAYSNIGDYKIGYNIKFILTDGTNYTGNFLEPDIFKFTDYFYVYVYDDVHQKDNSFYSHLEQLEDNTLMTSIKIYGVNLDNVENIILSAFTYNDKDDFDSEGNYRGNSIYTIRIKKK